MSWCFGCLESNFYFPHANIRVFALVSALDWKFWWSVSAGHPSHPRSRHACTTEHPWWTQADQMSKDEKYEDISCICFLQVRILLPLLLTQHHVSSTHSSALLNGERKFGCHERWRETFICREPSNEKLNLDSAHVPSLRKLTLCVQRSTSTGYVSRRLLRS